MSGNDVVEHKEEEVIKDEEGFMHDELSDEEFEKLYNSGELFEEPTEENVDNNTEETESSASNEEVSDDNALENKDDNTKEEVTTETKEEVEPKTEPEQTKELNYKEEYEKFLQPFKASGREFTPKSREELIRLAQMGVDYNKKQEANKETLRLANTLKENNLLDESKINMVIDIFKGNKDAITQLVKDLNINPFDINIEEEVEYKSNNYAPSTEEYNKAQVFQTLIETEEGKAVANDITEQWDETTQKDISANPHYFEMFVDHKRQGIFEDIQNEIVRGKLMGNIPQTMSFGTAYAEIFKHKYMNKNEPEQKVGNTQSNNGVSSNVLDVKLASKNRSKDTNSSKIDVLSASSNAKRVGNSPYQPSVEDVNSMSDDEFAAHYSKMKASGKI